MLEESPSIIHYIDSLSFLEFVFFVGSSPSLALMVELSLLFEGIVS